MKIQSIFRQLEHTPALDQRIKEKSSKLNKYFDGNLSLVWTCYLQEDDQHCSELLVKGPGFDFHAKAISNNLYKTFDKVISKIEKQLVKKKSKLRNKVHTNVFSLKEIQTKKSEEIEARVQFQIEEDAA